VQSLLYDSFEKSGVPVSSFSGRTLLCESWDMWHLHWPVVNIVSTTNGFRLLRLLIFFIELKAARLKKTKILWIVHNLRLRERNHPLLKGYFDVFFFRMSTVLFACRTWVGAIFPPAPTISIYSDLHDPTWSLSSCLSGCNEQGRSVHRLRHCTLLIIASRITNNDHQRGEIAVPGKDRT
jgi:hypothetical protein